MYDRHRAIIEADIAGLTQSSPPISHTVGAVFAHCSPSRSHIVGTFIDIELTHSGTIDGDIFTQRSHIARRGPGAASPRPTFVKRSRGTNIVGHYILSAARRD